MGLYVRGNKIWLRFQDTTGRWRSASSGYNVGDEAKALEVLAQVEDQIAKDRGTVTASGIIAESGANELLAAYARRWAKKRSKDDQTRVDLHIIPVLGHLRLGDVRPKHIKDFIEALKRARKRRRTHEGVLVNTDELLAPRTIRAIYSNLHVMFNDAVADELIATSPCVLKKGDLPQRKDKDPTWRRTAVFTRDEVETIISAPPHLIANDRRTLYALLFLGAMRFGEAAALTWADYDAACSPLGKLAITKSYNTDAKTVKATKTDNPREMPVHATLAKILATWKLTGWERYAGRRPKPEDLVVPSWRGRPRNVNAALKRFHVDLERIGLRARRQHDARRTFISIARADGARPDILRWATHGPTGDITDVYTTLPWATLCEEVAKAKIGLLEGEVIAMPKASGGGHGGAYRGPLQHPLQSANGAISNMKLEGVYGTPRRGKRALGDTFERSRVTAGPGVDSTDGYRAVDDRDTPLQDPALLAQMTNVIQSAIETQAADGYWIAQGVELPPGFAENVSRLAAADVVKCFKPDDAK